MALSTVGAVGDLATTSRHTTWRNVSTRLANGDSGAGAVREWPLQGGDSHALIPHSLVLPIAPRSQHDLLERRGGAAGRAVYALCSRTLHDGSAVLAALRGRCR